MTREELLAKIEAATGADRAIDEAIAETVFGVNKWKSKHGYWNVSFPNNWPFSDRPPSTVQLSGREPGFDYDPETGKKLPPEHIPTGWADSSFVELPEWTASIDAALGLVERLLPGCQWSREGDTGEIELMFHDGGAENWQASMSKGATPPLAILAALLLAIPPSNEAAR